MSSVSSTETKIPRLASSSSAQSGLPHALWRPQMQTFLMRQGIEDRDYSGPFPEWKAVVESIAADEKAEEQAAIDEMLGRTPSSAAAASSSKGPTAEQLKRKQRVIDAVARVRKAYAILYAALPSDLRVLIVDVPQGYAFGIWSFLEKKFRSTEQDSVMALWERLTSMRQDASNDANNDENFAEYKARVDSVVELLQNAKQIVSTGLYASLLLWRLRPQYSTAVLTLKTGDRLQDTDKIDWSYIADYMAQFERSQLGLSDTSPAEGNDRGYGARQPQQPGNNQQKKSANMSAVKCFNCNKMGHFAADCSKPNKRQKDEQGPRRNNDASSRGNDAKVGKNKNLSRNNNSSDSDDSWEEGKPRPRARFEERGNSARTVTPMNRFAALRSGDDDPDEEDEPSDAPAQGKRMGHSYLARALAGLQAGKLSESKSNQQQQQDSPRELKRLKRGADPEQPKQNNKAIAEEPVRQQSARSSIKEPTRRTPQPRGLDAELKTTAKAVDSAASVPMTPNREALVNVRRCAPMPIKVADGTVVTAMYKGDMPLRLRVDDTEKNVRVLIRDVYYHERFDANLLSWGQMRRDGWELHSTKDGTHLITPGGKKIRASTRGNLTILDDANPERVYSSRMGAIVCKTTEDLVSLHQRLGHVSWGRLVKMCRSGLTTGIGGIDAMSTQDLQKAEKAVKECNACAQGKQKRNALGSGGLDKGTAPGEVLHMDTMYVITRDARTGDKRTSYTLLATDGHSEWRWAACMNNMTDLQQECIDIMQHSHTMTGRYPRLVVTDLGSEFENGKVSAYCKSHGIKHQPTPARAKELNGLSEKSVDTVKNHSRTMLLASGVPEQVGKHNAITHHVYVWNRTHIGKRTGTTPYQAMMNKKPSILNLGMFGCDAFVHQDKSQRDTTHSAKGEPAVYLGHSGRQNAPIVRMLHTGKTIVVKDVIFREGSFQHARALRKGNAADIEPIDLEATEDETDSKQPDAPIVNVDSDAEEEKCDSDSDDEDDTKSRFNVRSIQNTRVVNGRKEYEVKWVGYPATTWEPADAIEADAPSAVRQYEKFLERRLEARVTRSRAPAKPAVASDSDDEEEQKESEHQQVMAARTVAASRL
jgi:hypothetical protein